MRRTDIETEYLHIRIYFFLSRKVVAASEAMDSLF